MKVERINTTNFKLVMNVTSRGIWIAVKLARGACVSLTPKKVLEYAEFSDMRPVVLSLVSHILKQLSHKGYLHIDNGKNVTRYMICRDSPLWELIKQSGGPEDVLNFIERVVE